MSLNIAMIGTGRIAATQLAPALVQADGIQLWSVLSRGRERAAEFAAQHGAAAPRADFDSLDELLADPALDAVLIATPDGLHAEQTLAAAAAGKHVLTEKPMATSSEQCEAVVKACAAAGVQLGLAYHLRWHAGHRALIEELGDGSIGHPRHMRVQWPTFAADDSGWRAQPEVGRWWSLSAVGTHCVDLVRWFMLPYCGEITDIKSIINRSVYASSHDQTAVLSVQFEDGATAEICTSVLFNGPRRAEIYGAKGYALCENTIGPDGAGSISLNAANFAFDVVNPYVGELEDFARAVRDGRAPEVDGAEGLRNVRILEQACP